MQTISLKTQPGFKRFSPHGLVILLHFYYYVKVPPAKLWFAGGSKVQIFPEQPLCPLLSGPILSAKAVKIIVRKEDLCVSMS
jgi:hypothetical protein